MPEPAVAPPISPAQITICGTLNRDTLAALVELAMQAGAALMVQPRPVVAVVEAATTPPKRLPPARRAARRGKVVATTPAARVAAGVVSDDAARAFLKRGPVAPAVFAAHFKLTVLQKTTVPRDLAARGVVMLSGTRRGRRIALPGSPAKEAL